MAKYNATFTSVWDGGFKVNSRCYVSKRKKLVTRMGRNDISKNIEESLDCLEEEYVVLDTGEKYKAVPDDEMEIYEEEVIGY